MSYCDYVLWHLFYIRQTSDELSSDKRPNYSVEHVRKGDLLLDPLVLRPKHLLQVLLVHPRPMHRQKEDETGEGNLTNQFFFWQMCKSRFTSPLPAGSSTLQHSLEEELGKNLASFERFSNVRKNYLRSVAGSQPVIIPFIKLRKQIKKPIYSP